MCKVAASDCSSEERPAQNSTSRPRSVRSRGSGSTKNCTTPGRSGPSAGARSKCASRTRGPLPPARANFAASSACPWHIASGWRFLLGRERRNIETCPSDGQTLRLRTGGHAGLRSRPARAELWSAPRSRSVSTPRAASSRSTSTTTPFPRSPPQMSTPMKGPALHRQAVAPSPRWKPPRRARPRAC